MSVRHAGHRILGPVRRFFGILGPGFVTGASDDDPSGIGTYAVAGATLGFAVLWTAWFTFPLMASVQFICAKIGMVSGIGLAGVLRDHYPRPLLYLAVTALLITNTINVGADLQAIAAALAMFVPFPLPPLIVVVGLLLLGIQIKGAYRQISAIFKWLAVVLLAYIGAAFFARPDLRAVLQGTLLPTFRIDGPFLTTFVAIVGTTISPYLFFWQSDMEVEDHLSKGTANVQQMQGATDQELKDAAVDVNAGMAFSNLVMYFIILATAATLHAAGNTHITSAAEAALALRPIAGEWAGALFALGIVGTGFLAVPILSSSAAYAVSEAFDWNYGLDCPPRRAGRFYTLIAVSTLAGIAMNFLGVNPIDALFWTAVLNGLIAPPLLVLVMGIANNRAVLGDRVNGPWLNVLGWAATAVMTLAALGLFWTWIR